MKEYDKHNMPGADFTSFYLKYSLHEEKAETRRGHTAIHCDYQRGEWNIEQFMEWIKRHIIGYALSPKEIRSLEPTQYVSAVERASRLIYGKEAKTEKRGEIGELILHGLIYDIYHTEPVISKIYMKTSRSDTVKGFDCVHALADGDELDSLWLGEAKFYKDMSGAIREAVDSIRTLSEDIALRNEFMIISNGIGDDEDPMAVKVKNLLKRSTSLDEITPKICVPVLLTYDSKVVSQHTSLSEEFVENLNAEVNAHLDSFKGAVTDIDLDIHVFIFSLADKAKLLEEFDKQLKGHQAE